MITQQHRMCDVCRLVDFDTTHKVCVYCSLCDAWICQSDFSDLKRRAIAAAKRILEPGYVGDPNFTAKVDQNV